MDGLNSLHREPNNMGNCEEDYAFHLVKRFKKFRKDKTFTDVVVIINDCHFDAHQLVLSASSQVFHAMLTSNMKEKSEGRIDLSHTYIKPCIFSELLDYIYTGKIAITSVNVQDMLAAANFLMLSSLTNKCWEFLRNALIADNCLGIMLTAKRFGYRDLIAKASDVLKTEFNQVLGSDEFVKLSVKELREVLQKDNLEVNEEEEILRGLLRWIYQSPEERMVHFSTLIESVRLQYIDPNVLDKYLYEENTFQTAKKDPRLVKLFQEAKDAWQCRVKYNELLQVGNNILPRNCLNKRNVLLGCGGYDGGKCTHTSFALDVNSFQVTYLAFMKVSKHDHGLAVVGNRLYSIGGFNSFRGPLNIVEMYNPARNSWSIITPMNSKRKSLGVCAVDNYIYVSGGLDASYSSLRSTEIFDTETKIWQYVSPMQEPKYAHAMVSDGKYIYALGGWKSDKVERYDPETDNWISLPPMQTPRAGPGVVYLNRKIYVTGGYVDYTCTNTTEVFDLDTGRWSNAPSMSVPRWRSGIVAQNDKIYVVGGRDSQWRYLDLVEVFDKNTMEWEIGGTLPVQVMGLRCCLLDVPIEHLDRSI